MNIDLLYDVQQSILDDPEQFDMSSWFGESECGTTACIAGWAVSIHYDNPIEKNDRRPGSWMIHFINRHTESTVFFEDVASDVLGIDDGPDTLFLIANWPDSYHNQYHQARRDENPRRAAHVAAHYISYWVNEHWVNDSLGVTMDYPGGEPDLDTYLAKALKTTL